MHAGNITRLCKILSTRVDLNATYPQMQHPNFTLMSSNFENLHNYHHQSEIYHVDLKLNRDRLLIQKLDFEIIPVKVWQLCIKCF